MSESQNQNMGAGGPNNSGTGIVQPGGSGSPAEGAAGNNEGNVGATQGLNQSPNSAEPPRWLLQRLDTTVAQKRDLEGQLARMQQELAAARGQSQGQGQNNNPAQAPAQPQNNDAEVRRLAAQMAAEQAFNSQCLEINAQGNREFPDFNAQITVYAKVLGTVPPSFVEGALETDNPAQTLYALTKDPDEIARIGNLSPARQAAAITKFGERYAAKLAAEAAKAKTPEQVPSQAPTGLRKQNPPNPIQNLANGNSSGGGAPKDISDASMSTAEWMKLRNEQIRAANRRS